jgi:hypothetical protein
MTYTRTYHAARYQGIPYKRFRLRGAQAAQIIVSVSITNRME